MKNYLSFGGGVNSVAMMLLLLDEGIEFEAVYVDHECDWPETHEYIKMLREKYPITIIRPEYKKRGVIFNNLYEYCLAAKIIPLRQIRWCTAEFKVNPLHRYFQKPCFVMLGIDAGESHRAKLSSDQGMENRFPLIEREITRAGCIEIIKAHNLPVPMKSGCWFCPFQRIGELKKLRHLHPELFCKAVKLEKTSLDYALSKGRSIANSTLIKPKTLTQWIDERDSFLFEELSYPPCQCGL
jgi:3'-phosphoadenosine 5'-phosphosulfate sulfotransferase (PAPS reductase)/FAD synthetase